MTDLVGIVACGGQSRRMGKDKSLLDYHGKPQWQFLYELLQPLCKEVLVSCSPEQAVTITPPYMALVDDENFSGSGPIAGVLTALEKFPSSAILVVGCDYPFVSDNELKELIAARTQDCDAVCFFNAETTIHEPLIAVYEATAYPKLREQFTRDRKSLRSFLAEGNTHVVIPGDSGFLLSVDDAKGYTDAKELLLSRQNQFLLPHSGDLAKRLKFD